MYTNKLNEYHYLMIKYHNDYDNQINIMLNLLKLLNIIIIMIMIMIMNH